MWENLRQIVLRLWQRHHERAEAQRAAKKRTRFWAELREGEREAEASSGS